MTMDSTSSRAAKASSGAAEDSVPGERFEQLTFSGAVANGTTGGGEDDGEGVHARVLLRCCLDGRIIADSHEQSNTCREKRFTAEARRARRNWGRRRMTGVVKNLFCGCDGRDWG